MELGQIVLGSNEEPGVFLCWCTLGEEFLLKKIATKLVFEWLAYCV